MKEESVVKKEENAIAIPEHIKPSMDGLESMEVEHITMPRCNLVNGLSKAHTEDNVALGHFVNNINGDDYGESFDFVCLIFKPGFVKYDEDRNMIARKFAGDFLRPIKPETITAEDKIFHGKEKPAANETFLYVGYINGKGPIALSLMNTGITEGRKFNTMLMEDDRAAYAKRYKVKSRKESNEKGTWYVTEFKANGWLKPDEYKKVEAGYQKLTKKKVEVDLREDAPTPAKTGEKKDKKETPEPDAEAF